MIDRVITNENRFVQVTIQQYSPLVETYIQSLKPDKELGYVPAGDKYFLSRADFTKGVAVVSLTDVSGKGKKAFGAIGNLLAFSAQFMHRRHSGSENHNPASGPHRGPARLSVPPVTSVA